MTLDWKRFQNASIITLNDTTYYPLSIIEENKKFKKPKSDSNSKWNKKEDKKSEVIYINATTNKITPNIDFEYAEFLAYYFTDGAPKAACCEMVESSDEPETSLENAKLLESKVLTDFESREYGFVNKRLPVVKLAYDTPEKTTYFIETSTSRLAAVIKNSDKIEGYSFAIFHKFLFMDWAGKNIRDFTMVLAALIILLVSLLGLILFLKKR